MVQMMMTKTEEGSANGDCNEYRDETCHDRIMDGVVTIGHPSGCLHVEVQVEVMEDKSNGNNNDLCYDEGQDQRQQEPVLKRSVIGRTARRIMDGYVYLKPHTIKKLMDSRDRRLHTIDGE